MSLTYDESAVMADVVLPDTSFLEKDQYHPMSGSVPHKVMEDDTRGYRPFLWRDASKIRRPYNAHTVDEMWLELGERVGVLLGKDGMIDRVNRGLGLKDFPLDIERPTSLRAISEAYLKQIWGGDLTLAGVNDASGPVYKYMHRGAKNYNYFYWPDSTTRFPMYFVQMKRLADGLRKGLAEAGLSGVPGWVNMDDYWKAFVPIPVWTPCPEFYAPAEYDMWAMNWKTPMAPFYCGDTFGNVWLHETMSTFDPYEYAIWMNAATGWRKGIKDGDTIVVESRYGKTQGRVKLTELIHPEVVGFPSGHGARSNLANPIVGEGPYFNALCSIHEKDQATDPITGGIEEGPAVKVYKA
jgi:anaerobic selenocysteine-containing dehydrogenase